MVCWTNSPKAPLKKKRKSPCSSSTSPVSSTKKKILQAFILQQWRPLLHSREDQAVLSYDLYHPVEDYKHAIITACLLHQLLLLLPPQVRVFILHHPHFFRILINDQRPRLVSIFTQHLLSRLLFVSLLTDPSLLIGQYPFRKRIIAIRSRLRREPACARLQLIEARFGVVCIKTLRARPIRRRLLQTGWICGGLRWRIRWLESVALKASGW
jgi:hypothetical protein